MFFFIRLSFSVAQSKAHDAKTCKLRLCVYYSYVFKSSLVLYIYIYICTFFLFIFIFISSVYVTLDFNQFEMVQFIRSALLAAFSRSSCPLLPCVILPSALHI